IPSKGVTSVGLVAKTNEPDPVSSVHALAILAEENVPNIVTTPVPSPLTPDEIGNPVQFVNVPDAGVPSTGVTNVGLVAKTNDPDPVSSVHAAFLLADEKVPNIVATPVPKPETPVEIG